MNRAFFTNVLFLILVNLLIKPFYIFGIDRTVQNTLEPGEYGIYFALFNFTFLFQIINDFGIQNFNNRNIAQYNQLLDKYFPNILILKLLLGLIYLLVVFTFAWVSNYEGSYYHLLLFIAINQILLSLILYFRSNISGLALYRTDSIISVLEKLLLIGLCSILLWVEPFRSNFKVEWFVYAQTTSLLLTAICAFLIVRNRIQRLRFRFNPAFLLLILKKSYPYALVIFLMTVYSRIDAVMLERMLPNGKLEADIYASAYRLLDASNMIGFLFAGLLLPMFSKLLKERADISDLLNLSFQFIWAGAISLSASTFFFQQEIMETLYLDGSAYSGQILGLLILSFIAISASYVYGTLLTANGNLRLLNIVSICGVILNVTVNMILIPEYKAYGASLATLITQGLVTIAHVFLAKRSLHLSFQPLTILRLAAFILTVFGWSYFLYNSPAENWLWHFLLSFGSGLVLAFVFRLIHLRSMIGMILSRK